MSGGVWVCVRERVCGSVGGRECVCVRECMYVRDGEVAGMCESGCGVSVICGDEAVVMVDENSRDKLRNWRIRESR